MADEQSLIEDPLGQKIPRSSYKVHGRFCRTKKDVTKDGSAFIRFGKRAKHLIAVSTPHQHLSLREKLCQCL